MRRPLRSQRQPPLRDCSRKAIGVLHDDVGGTFEGRLHFGGRQRAGTGNRVQLLQPQTLDHLPQRRRGSLVVFAGLVRDERSMVVERQ